MLLLTADLLRTREDLDMLSLLESHYEVRVFIPQEEPAGPETAYIAARELCWDEHRHVLLLDPSASPTQDRNLVRRAASAGLNAAALIPDPDWGLGHFIVVMMCADFAGLCEALPAGPTRSMLHGFG